MRANGFKKALILAAAAFVTAVIGVGGAKLKVQAAEYTTGPVLDLNASDYGSFIKEGVAFGLSSNPGQAFTVNFQEYNGNPIVGGFAVGGADPLTHNMIENNEVEGEWWELIDYSATNPNEHYTFRKACTVTYKNEDGTVLQSTVVSYNAATPNYTGANPTKAPSGGYIYSWDSTDGWTTVVAANVTSNVTYTAKFTATPSYTITWKNDDGTTLRTDTVAAGDLPSYGGTPSKPDDANYTYTFSMWSPTVQLATADATYTAVYLQDPKPAPATGGGEDDSSSSTGDGSSSGDGTNGGANGNRAPKTADTMPGIIVIALAGLLGGALLITGSRKSSNR